MMGIDEDGSRRTALADLLEDSATLHLGKSPASEFAWRGHAKDACVGEPLDKITRNVCISINPVWIKFAIEHLPNLSQRAFQFGFLGGGEPRIRHHPIGDEIAKEQTFGEPKFLASAEQQLLSLLHFFLSLNFCFGLCHDQNVPDRGSRTVFVGAVMSTQPTEYRRDNLTRDIARPRPLAGARTGNVQNTRPSKLCRRRG